MENACAAETFPRLSVALTLKLNGLPDVVVGLPLMMPDALSNVSPVGKAPLATAQPL
jgi:hypothetical protein